MTAWYEGRLCGFDLETTGVDLENDRIVTACAVQCGGKQDTQSINWLADPGIEIPDEAAKVHGITTERARAEGRPAAEVVEQLVAALAECVHAGLPIIAMNASFDLTILDREARRHGVKPRVRDRLSRSSVVRSFTRPHPPAAQEPAATRSVRPSPTSPCRASGGSRRPANGPGTRPT